MSDISKGLLALCVLIIALSGTTSAWADFADGWRAYHQGRYEAAHDAWTAPANQGDTDLQFHLGVLFEAGYLGEPDFAKAASWYDRAASRGLPAAQHRLGALYARGLGLEPDIEKAIELYRQAAEAGFAPAQFSLAVALEQGVGVPVDTDAASLWYHRAARQGLAAAQYNLGRTFATAGDGNDPEQSLNWYRRAAEDGLAEAQNNLGLMYERGIGVPQDYVAAARWYALAADQGLAVAHNNMGVMYHFGRGVPHDPDRATAAYYAAAVGGNAEGQINLAFVLANGIGVQQDLIEAYAWVLIARVGDDPDAAQAAREYGRRLLTLLSNDHRRAGLERATILRATLQERPATQIRRLTPIPTDAMGSDIAAAQRYLEQHGMLDSVVDGVSGPMTSNAIKSFQEIYGLQATGVANASLITAMADRLTMPWQGGSGNTIDRRP